MTGGDLKIEVLPAGAVVPAFGLLDAVSKGTLDGGHGVLVYHYGKNTALALWGSGPGYAMDANMLLAWHKYGGGKELLAEALRVDRRRTWCRSRTHRIRRSRSAGSRSRSPSVDDFKGLKYRTVGISIDLFTAMGAAVNALPGGEIVRRSTAACSTRPSSTTPRPTARSASPTSPRSACCRATTRTPSSSRSASTRPSTMRCRTKMQAIIDNARRSALPHDMQWKAIDRNSQDYIELQTKDKVKFYKTPDAILQRQLELYDEIVEEVRGRQIRCSRRSSSRRSRSPSARRSWEQDYIASRKMAFDHYFGAEREVKPI